MRAKLVIYLIFGLSLLSASSALAGDPELRRAASPWEREEPVLFSSVVFKGWSEEEIRRAVSIAFSTPRHFEKKAWFDLRPMWDSIVRWHRDCSTFTAGGIYQVDSSNTYRVNFSVAHWPGPPERPCADLVDAFKTDILIALVMLLSGR